jgi:hypothetical protein
MVDGDSSEKHDEMINLERLPQNFSWGHILWWTVFWNGCFAQVACLY